MKHQVECIKHENTLAGANSAHTLHEVRTQTQGESKSINAVGDTHYGLLRQGILPDIVAGTTGVLAHERTTPLCTWGTSRWSWVGAMVAAVDPDARHLLRAATLHHRVGGTGLCEGTPVEEGPP